MNGTEARSRSHILRRLRRAITARAGLTMGGARGALVGQPVLGAGLIVVSVLVAFGMVLAPEWVPAAAMFLVLLAAVLVLRGAAMLGLVVAVVLEVTLISVFGWARFTPGVLLVLALGLGVSMIFVRSRELLGLQGVPSQLMLVDLRDRLAAHGRIPELPGGWRVESVVRSANGEGFSGDFVVAARGAGGPLLEIVLVDVSGKGQEAGVRSLLLSGAFGGLLGAMAPAAFLPAANVYLLDQRWSEGFATAVHLAVRLDTGEYWVTRAGHPPAIHLHAGTGTVELLRDDGGMALGVVLDPVFGARQGVLEPGDTLMLYTDGLVENPRRDLDQGIDRLTGVAEQLLATGRGGAADVLATLHTGEADDRALVLVRRS